jgi:hypothetical protein
MVIDSEIENEIKRVLADNITKEYKDESMKNKELVNITSTIDRTPTDRFNGPNNTNVNSQIAPHHM